LYHEVPKRYTWHRQTNEWKPRKRGAEKTIGRMISVSPKDVERYHLRLLLCFVKSPKSFEDLRTVNGQVLPTFQEAARVRGLLEDDQEWHRCMREAAEFRMPQSLRYLYVTILTSCSPSDPRSIWEENLHSLSEDYQRELDCDSTDRRVVYRTLLAIERNLESNGFSLCGYPMLPQLCEFEDLRVGETVRNPLIDLERAFDRRAMEEVMGGPALNEGQQSVFDKILGAVNNAEATEKLFFVDGPGGTGKSFLLEKVIAAVRLDGKIALAVATSGIAALQLSGGRTAYSVFKLPIKLNAESTCSIPRQSHRARLLREASIIVWDEAPMMHRHGFEALDRTLRDLMGNDLIFGGKVVVISGDFRQILPVVLRGRTSDIINACVKRSYLWRSFVTLRLTSNMRIFQGLSSGGAVRLQEFARFLLEVGEGRQTPCAQCGRHYAQVPKEMMMAQGSSADVLGSLIDHVYPDVCANIMVDGFLSGRAILTPWNVEVHGINDRVLDRLPTECSEYHSIDSVEDVEGMDTSMYQVEFLNSLEISGMPPHKLRLKVGAPIMLLRNIDGDQGLCNGTRLQVQRLTRNCIVARVLTGPKRGNTAFIPRIPLIASDFGLPFSLRRRQFPVMTAFAMTINKAQGQTVPNLGVYLPRPVFAHGQLYVALSRATSPDNIKIVVDYEVHESAETVCVDNVVYPGIAT